MDKKITVLFVETGNYGGGSFESLYQNIANLDRERFKPIVFYLNRTPYVKKMRALGVKVYLVGDILYNNVIPNVFKRILVALNWAIGSVYPKLTIFYEWAVHVGPILKLRRIVRQHNVDVIQLNNTIVRHFFCIVGLKDMGIPIISYLRSFIIKGVNPFMAAFSNHHVTCYVAYSEGVREFWEKVGVDKHKTRIIYNGIEITDIEPLDVWNRIGAECRGGPLVGCVGGIKVNRTYDFMIKSFVHILREEPDAFLVIVGRWMDRGLGEKLQKLAGDLGISESVLFHGPDREAIRIIAGLDVLTIPYRVEPYGRILLEAWIAETPVVATRVGHIDKIITHEKDGLLVNHGDTKAMSQAVLRIWRDKCFSKLLTQEGKKTVEKRFAIRTCTEKLENLYRQIASGKRS